MGPVLTALIPTIAQAAFGFLFRPKPKTGIALGKLRQDAKKAGLNAEFVLSATGGAPWARQANTSFFDAVNTSFGAALSAGLDAKAAAENAAKAAAQPSPGAPSRAYAGPVLGVSSPQSGGAVGTAMSDMGNLPGTQSGWLGGFEWKGSGLFSDGEWWATKYSDGAQEVMGGLSLLVDTGYNAVRSVYALSAAAAPYTTTPVAKGLSEVYQRSLSAGGGASYWPAPGQVWTPAPW